MKAVKMLALLGLLVLCVGGGAAAQTTQQRASITVTPTTLDFGEVVVNRQNQVFKVLTFKIKNTGNVELRFQVENPSTPFSISGSVSRLSPDQEVTVSVRFQPTTGGKFSNAVIFKSTNVMGLSGTVILKGQGNEPSIVLDTNVLDFGTVKAAINTVGSQFTNVQFSQAKSQTFKITNRGQATLSGDITFTSSAFFLQTSGQTNPILTDNQQFSASFTVNEGGSATVTIKFLPREAESFNTTVTIRSNDPKQSSLTVQLRGIGTAPELDVDRTTITFKDVFVSGTGTTAASESIEFLTIENTGNETLSVTTNSPCSEFTVSTNTGITGGGTANLSSMDPGVKVKIQIVFKPTFIGSFECVLLINSNDPENPTTRVSLKGKGVSSSTRTNGIPAATAQAPLQVSASRTGLSLRADAQVAWLRLFVYDTQGRAVYDSGTINTAQLNWQGVDQQGFSLANGVYFYRVVLQRQTGEVIASKVEKIAILR